MTVRITKLAVVGRLVQLCLTALCAVGIRAAWVSALPVRIANWGLQVTYRIPNQMDEGAALGVTCLYALGIVLIWGFTALMGAPDEVVVEAWDCGDIYNKATGDAVEYGRGDTITITRKYKEAADADAD